MSKQLNKTMIGGFVVGAIVIVVAGILIFGSGRFFTDKRYYALYFDGSVKGLSIGAPVQLKGVPIGQVTDISLLADPITLKFYTRVVIEVLPNKILSVGKEREAVLPDGETDELVKLLVRQGLRAKLEISSFVTGQLLVAFDFYPDTDIRKTGFKTGFKELPTLPSDLENLLKKMEKIPVTELANEILDTVEAINRLVRSPHMESIIANADQTVQDVGKTARKIDAKVTQLTEEMTLTARDARKMVNNLDRHIDPIASGVDTTLKSATAALEKTNEASAAVSEMLGEDSELRHNLRVALRQISSAAKSVGLLADYLEQHPEALLKGKPGGN